MRAAAATFIWLIAAPPTPAQEQALQILEAWKSWALVEGVSASSITIGYEGREVVSDSIGVPAGTRWSLASLSKAITGACVDVLVKSGQLSYETKLSEVLGTEVDVTSENASITITELLTHTSGLWPDSTQEIWAGLYGIQKDIHLDVTKTALARANEPRGEFRYNNENYAVLGAIIARVSKAPYAQVCRAAVLDPAGVSSAVLSPEWGSLAAWGGWAMTTADYSRFLAHVFGPDGRLGSDPLAGPSTRLGNGIFYGAGIRMKRAWLSFDF